MFYEKRTLKKERKAKGHEGRVEVFFFKVCLSAGWRLGGEQRAEGYLARHSCSSSARKKKHEDISMEIMISSKKKQKNTI